MGLILEILGFLYEAFLAAVSSIGPLIATLAATVVKFWSSIRTGLMALLVVFHVATPWVTAHLVTAAGKADDLTAMERGITFLHNFSVPEFATDIMAYANNFFPVTEAFVYCVTYCTTFLAMIAMGIVDNNLRRVTDGVKTVGK